MRLIKGFVAIALCMVLSAGFAFAAPQVDPANQETLQKASEAYAAKDYAKAKKILKPLADKNDLMATFALGLMAARGEGEKKNMKNAEKWWIKSANAGNPQAQF